MARFRRWRRVILPADDPFTAPRSVATLKVFHESAFADASFRVDGDLLVCGAEADLTGVCWLSGHGSRWSGHAASAGQREHSLVPIDWCDLHADEIAVEQSGPDRNSGAQSERQTLVSRVFFVEVPMNFAESVKRLQQEQ